MPCTRANRRAGQRRGNAAAGTGREVTKTGRRVCCQCLLRNAAETDERITDQRQVFSRRSRGGSLQGAVVHGDRKADRAVADGAAGECVLCGRAEAAGYLERTRAGFERWRRNSPNGKPRIGGAAMTRTDADIPMLV